MRRVLLSINHRAFTSKSEGIVNETRRSLFTPPMANSKPALFDTHLVVQTLEGQGFTPTQAEAVLHALKVSAQESLEHQQHIMATKANHEELKAALSEKVFNSTLKFDISQRHMRELLDRDFNNLKQEIRTLESNDFNQIRREMNELERKLLLHKQELDERFNKFSVDIEVVEKRVLQYAMGFAGTVSALGLGIARLLK